MLLCTAILMYIVLALIDAAGGNFDGLIKILLVIITIPIIFAILWFIAETGIWGIIIITGLSIALGNHFSKKWNND